MGATPLSATATPGSSARVICYSFFNAVSRSSSWATPPATYQRLVARSSSILQLHRILLLLTQGAGGEAGRVIFIRAAGECLRLGLRSTNLNFCLILSNWIVC